MLDILPERISINIVDKNSLDAISRIAVAVTLYAIEKNDYVMIPKPSDEHGKIVIDNQWFLREIDRLNSMSIMDYSSLIEDQISIDILSNIEVHNVIEYMNIWKYAFKTDESEVNQFSECRNYLYKPEKLLLKSVAKQIVNVDIFLERILT